MQERQSKQMESPKRLAINTIFIHPGFQSNFLSKRISTTHQILQR